MRVQPFCYDCIWKDCTSLAWAHSPGSSHARKPRIYTSRHNCAWMSKKYYLIFLIVFKISEIVKCEFDGRSNRSWCKKSSFTFCQSLSKAWWRSTNYSRFIFFQLLIFKNKNFGTFFVKHSILQIMISNKSIPWKNIVFPLMSRSVPAVYCQKNASLLLSRGKMGNIILDIVWSKMILPRILRLFTVFWGNVVQNIIFWEVI